MVLNNVLNLFDIFLNIWNLILWRGSGKKRSSFYGYSKYGAFILEQSEQQFKIQYHFGISDTVIGEGQWYDDASSHSLKFICGLFRNVSFFYWMKSFLDLCKSQVDAELIYNLSSFSTFDILHLLRYDWSNMACIQFSHPNIILFLLIVGLIYFGMYLLSGVYTIHTLP